MNDKKISRKDLKNKSVDELLKILNEQENTEKRALFFKEMKKLRIPILIFFISATVLMIFFK
jgi:hypothetical protein